MNARPGVLHRVPAGAKLIALAVMSIATLSLVKSWELVVIAAVVLGALWLVSRVGLAELARQFWILRWMIVFLAVTQLLFTAPAVALVTTSRVVIILLMASLLTLTTPVSELLDAFHAALRPLKGVGVDADRVALLLALTITTVPVIARLAAGIREARSARGASTGVTGYGVPLLVLSLQHADELGDAIDARGG
jgi:biotin transport system permease protein